MNSTLQEISHILKLLRLKFGRIIKVIMEKFGGKGPHSPVLNALWMGTYV